MGTGKGSREECRDSFCHSGGQITKQWCSYPGFSTTAKAKGSSGARDEGAEDHVWFAVKVSGSLYKLLGQRVTSEPCALMLRSDPRDKVGSIQEAGERHKT